MATRPANYYDSVDRTDSVGYNPNAVNILYNAKELQAVQYSQAVFGNRENYLLWLKAQAENNILELLKTLNGLITEAGSTDSQIATYVLLGAAALTKTGVSTLAAGIVTGVGTLVGFIERKQKNNALELIKAQAQQVQTELLKQKAIYESAVSELSSIRNTRLIWGLIVAFLLYLFTKKRS